MKVSPSLMDLDSLDLVNTDNDMKQIEEEGLFLTEDFLQELTKNQNYDMLLELEEKNSDNDDWLNVFDDDEGKSSKKKDDESWMNFFSKLVDFGK